MEKNQKNKRHYEREGKIRIRKINRTEGKMIMSYKQKQEEEREDRADKE